MRTTLRSILALCALVGPPTALISSAAHAQECVPQCRQGFVCMEGYCVTACNPPCPEGQSCTADLRCVPPLPAAAAPPVMAPSSRPVPQSAQAAPTAPPPQTAPGAAPPQYVPSAQQLGQPPVSAERHEGFHLRLALGFGYHNASLSEGDLDLTMSGGSINLVVAAGLAVAPNLFVHGEIFPIFLPAGSAEVAGSGGIDPSTDVQGQIFGLGAGMTYYIMPADIYVSGTLGLGLGGYEVPDGGGDLDLDAGFALNLLLGKEWHVGGRWGVGIAGQLYYASMPIEDAASRVDNIAVLGAALLFSAGLN